MTLRLRIRFFILLIMAFISLQHPVPESDSVLRRIPKSKFLITSYEKTEDEKPHTRYKRQAWAMDKTTENKRQNQNPEQIVRDENLEDNIRNKREESDEEQDTDREQFYKPEHGDSKHESSFLPGTKVVKIDNAEHEIANDLRGPTNLNVIRQERLASKDREVVSGLQPSPGEVFTQEGQKTEDQMLEEHLVGSEIVGPMQRIGSKETFDRKERESDEIPEAADLQNFSPEYLETIRKINPLTIGDQVSQRLRNQKYNTKDKLVSKSCCGSCPRMLQGEDQVAESYGGGPQDNEEALRQPSPYEKPQPPKIVQKPCSSNDYGFSVIILAGDPIKVGNSGVQAGSGRKEVNSSMRKQNGHIGGFNEDQCRDRSKIVYRDSEYAGIQNRKKEFRVPKDPNANVEFPVYDEDLTFVPDPFHGLLDENYWSDKSNHDKNKALDEKNQDSPQHRLWARSLPNRRGGKGDPKGDPKGFPKGYPKGSPKGDSKGYPKGDTMGDSPSTIQTFSNSALNVDEELTTQSGFDTPSDDDTPDEPATPDFERTEPINKDSPCLSYGTIYNNTNTCVNKSKV